MLYIPENSIGLYKKNSIYRKFEKTKYNVFMLVVSTKNPTQYQFESDEKKMVLRVMIFVSMNFI